MNHECCNETCPLTSCQLASPLCIADADTRFAVQRHDRQAREEAERREALTPKRRPYFAEYYRDNRSEKLSAAKFRHESLKDDPEYRELRAERERQRRKFARV